MQVFACLLAVVALVSALGTKDYSISLPDDVVQGFSAQKLIGPVSYGGGPIIPNVQIYTAYFGNYTNKDQMDLFYAGITTSSFFQQLSEFNTPTQSFGFGSFQGRLNNNIAFNFTSFSKNILALYSLNNITPNINTYLALHFGPEYDAYLESCGTWCAYHSGFGYSNGTTRYYAVIPNCSGGDTCGGLGFDNTAWPNNEAEIADLCAYEPVTFSYSSVTYTSQKIWSNALNSCYPAETTLPAVTSTSTTTTTTTTSTSTSAANTATTSTTSTTTTTAGSSTTSTTSNPSTTSTTTTTSSPSTTSTTTSASTSATSNIPTTTSTTTTSTNASVNPTSGVSTSTQASASVTSSTPADASSTTTLSVASTSVSTSSTVSQSSSRNTICDFFFRHVHEVSVSASSSTSLLSSSVTVSVATSSTASSSVSTTTQSSSLSASASVSPSSSTSISFSVSTPVTASPTFTSASASSSASISSTVSSATNSASASASGTSTSTLPVSGSSSAPTTTSSTPTATVSCNPAKPPSANNVCPSTPPPSDLVALAATGPVTATTPSTFTGSNGADLGSSFANTLPPSAGVVNPTEIASSLVSANVSLTPGQVTDVLGGAVPSSSSGLAALFATFTSSIYTFGPASNVATFGVESSFNITNTPITNGVLNLIVAINSNSTVLGTSSNGITFTQGGAGISPNVSTAISASGTASTITTGSISCSNIAATTISTCTGSVSSTNTPTPTYTPITNNNIYTPATTIYTLRQPPLHLETAMAATPPAGSTNVYAAPGIPAGNAPTGNVYAAPSSAPVVSAPLAGNTPYTGQGAAPAGNAPTAATTTAKSNLYANNANKMVASFLIFAATCIALEVW
ncbi:UNVERIFIED_CONTAM: hypothetical protein HDU68_009553 [Siphonaria sp. JEL0065]|nr:hypothetical protein HDU68_009553 [Siphonaria sp. JEL0065]